MKTCRKCGEDKPKSAYYASKQNKDGLNSYCKQCKNGHGSEYQRTTKGRMYHRNRHLTRTYGITNDDFQAMLHKQQGKCACCGTLDPRGPGRFHVDHNHTTGNIRGLLCNTCNLRLGVLENREFVSQVNVYLQEYDNETHGFLYADSGQIPQRWLGLGDDQNIPS